MSTTPIKLSMELRDVAKSYIGMFTSSKALGFREDLIYTKGFGGDVMSQFTYPANSDDISIPKDFAVFDANEFLNVLDFMEPDKLKVNLEEVNLKLKDGKKTIQYRTCPMDLVSEPNQSIIDSFNEAEDVLTKFILDEGVIEEITKSLAVMELDQAFLLSNEEKSLIIRLSSSKTNNYVDIPLKGVAKENINLELPSSGLFKILYPGIYKCQVKRFEIQGSEFSMLRLDNSSMKKEVDGELYYMAVLDDEDDE